METPRLQTCPSRYSFCDCERDVNEVILHTNREIREAAKKKRKEKQKGSFSAFWIRHVPFFNEWVFLREVCLCVGSGKALFHRSRFECCDTWTSVSSSLFGTLEMSFWVKPCRIPSCRLWIDLTDGVLLCHLDYGVSAPLMRPLGECVLVDLENMRTRRINREFPPVSVLLHVDYVNFFWANFFSCSC